jgi:Asp-tRNA(Asn)/Glu-tRNA(Gln) amidotransferase A subunit family amidase
MAQAVRLFASARRSRGARELWRASGGANLVFARRRAHYFATEVVVSDFWRLDATAQAARFFLEYDVWHSPTLVEPPPALGSFDPTPDNRMSGIFRAAQFVPFTPIFNVTGQPAMSVPRSWNQENLPIGVQFAGRFGDEATLFRLAAQLEQARPWTGRWPTLS